METAQTDEREAYWQATRKQLDDAQQRADRFTLTGILATCSALWWYHTRDVDVPLWTALNVGLALAIVGGAVWYLARSRRRISAARGLTCSRCAYVPHDSEIVEVAHSRECRRCGATLE